MKSEEALKKTEAGIDELIAALEQGKSERLIEFLEFQAKFHNYSFRNCLLIALQRPSATYVAGFQRWKSLGRHVKKGEQGIMILAPIVRRRKSEDDKGQESDEDEAQMAQAIAGFRAAYVFDVAQTEGKELPEFSRIMGEPGEMLFLLADQVKERGIELSYAEDLSGADGRSEGGKIVIREGLDPAHEFAVLSHELAHELLHRTERRKETTRRIRELEAEAVAYVVSNAVGLKGLTRSADYIQLYSGDKDMLLASLDHIQRVAAEIIEALETAKARAESCAA